MSVCLCCTPHKVHVSCIYGYFIYDDTLSQDVPRYATRTGSIPCRALTNAGETRGQGAQRKHVCPSSPSAPLCLQNASRKEENHQFVTRTFFSPSSVRSRTEYGDIGFPPGALCRKGGRYLPTSYPHSTYYVVLWYIGKGASKKFVNIYSSRVASDLLRECCFSLGYMYVCMFNLFKFFVSLFLYLVSSFS
ncbi:hypothetical protein GGS26DRAFT_204305 [Hypomontagnella submonticulosa]|nr:hypothetical protein GGS26DRAFT_204305 [Hypomontagnella submonticulosa]